MCDLIGAEVVCVIDGLGSSSVNGPEVVCLIEGLSSSALIGCYVCD